MAEIVYAKSKYVRRSARKIRLVADMIRGMKAERALEVLMFTNKAAADDVYKVVKSAIANATFNSDMDKKELVIVESYVNEAPTFKRGKAVSRGRYHRIFRRNSHIVIGVSDKSDAAKVAKKEETKKNSKSVKKVEAKETVSKKKEVKKVATKAKNTKTKSKSKSKSNKKK